MTVDTQSAYEKFTAIDWSGTPFEGCFAKPFSVVLSAEQRAWVMDNESDPRSTIVEALEGVLAAFNQSIPPELVDSGGLWADTAMRCLLGPLFDAIREASN